ncbi:MAG: MFS transporter, partial [Anaerolineae bacterium]|nr:MFS transporter [Anaerolineae bacterium]NIN94964.1 MFS transporter [Anaerolineae bacterium]NIQ78008.1 MFS transporter [Anaerolineae bacterium]
MTRLREEFGFIQGNYLVLVISWIFMDFAMELPRTYYPFYVVDPALGGSPFTLGLIGFASFIALASVQFPGGYLADRFGRRWLVTTMTFGIALSFILYAVAPSWHWILLGAAINSLCLIYQPALMAMIADSVPSERRGMGFSIITLIERTAS